MSAKSEIDKATNGYPWTPRQTRMKASNRQERKKQRKTLRFRNKAR